VRVISNKLWGGSIARIVIWKKSQCVVSVTSAGEMPVRVGLLCGFSKPSTNLPEIGKRRSYHLFGNGSGWAGNNLSKSLGLEGRAENHT
jgi:hypothetical protein